MIEIKSEQEGSLFILARPEDVPLHELGPLSRGVSKHYRGKHRSQFRGKGWEAFHRNKWMKVLSPPINCKKSK